MPFRTRAVRVICTVARRLVTLWPLLPPCVQPCHRGAHLPGRSCRSAASGGVRRLWLKAPFPPPDLVLLCCHEELRL